jgi:hypothetical protein
VAVLIDYACVNEVKRLKREYELNPDSVSLALKYSQSLSVLMRQIYGPQVGTYEELAAYRTLLKPLTEVYQRHFDVEWIALNYLCAIGYIPQHLGDDVAMKMMEIYRRFPNNKYAVELCEIGLGVLVLSHVAHRDTVRAEREVRYLEILYIHNPTNEAFATDYAVALQDVASIQDFFAGTETADKLEKLAERYPYNGKIVSAYESVKEFFSVENYFLSSVIENRYIPSPQKSGRPDYEKSVEKPILKEICDLFVDMVSNITHDIIFGCSNDKDVSYGDDDSDCDVDDD